MSAYCSTSPLCDVPRTANCSGYFPLVERIAGLKELWYNNLRRRWHLPGQGCEAADTGDAGYYFCFYHRRHLPGLGCEAADAGDAGYYFYLTKVVFVP